MKICDYEGYQVFPCVRLAAVFVFFPVTMIISKLMTRVTYGRKGLLVSQFQVIVQHFREVKASGTQ